MPGVEAHGAYAFCALGCLSILDSPHRSIPKYVVAVANTRACQSRDKEPCMLTILDWAGT